jgi:hypothetical protein
MRKSFKTTAYYVLGIMISAWLLLISTGCGVKSEPTTEAENVTAKAGTVQLYHATDTGVEPDQQRYQLMQPDNLSAALEEVIENLSVNEKLSIEKYLIDEEKNITLFITQKDVVTEEELLLNQAAIVRSIQGLDCSDINITFTDLNGEIISTATYTDASFYYYNE